MSEKVVFTQKDFSNGNFIKELPSTYKQGKTRIQRTRWGLFRCLHCGQLFESNLFAAKKIQVKYCSKQCVMAATRSQVDGGNEKHPLYSRWLSMRQRCLNPSSSNYKNYGARGIKIEDFLLDFGNYVHYVESLPNYPSQLSEDWQLDRIDNDKGYERGNLRWTNRSIQITNTRKKTNSYHSNYVGITYSTIHKKWVARINFKGKVLYARTFDTEYEAVIARDKFIIENNLTHTLNILERATTIP